MSDRRFMREGLPEDFQAPTVLPAEADQARRWQAHNRAWWERHPMAYDETESSRLQAEPGSLAFYREIDERFFRRARQIIGWRRRPFESLIDLDALRGQRVLEIGVGCGSHAELLSQSARAFTGVDLTEYATRMTHRRLALLGRRAAVLRMDAEQLAFPDASFDFVWSWGVIHHSANTSRALDEIYRVLRPGGAFTCMVYHWSPWNAWIRGGLYYGLLRGGFRRTRSLHRLLQETTDGAIARYYTVDEWRGLASKRFTVESIRVLGHKEQLLPLPFGALKERLAALIPDGLGRWIVNRPAIGFMLTSTLRKPAT